MKRVFIDMDGVLCECGLDGDVAEMERDGYFRELKPRRNMLDAVKYLIEKKCAEVYILSAVLPQKIEGSITEKNDWLNRFIPEIDARHRLFPVCGTDKADAVTAFGAEDILCDDYSHNLHRWVDASGKGVKIINEVNGIKGEYTRGPRINVNRPEELYLTVMAV